MLCPGAAQLEEVGQVPGLPQALGLPHLNTGSQVQEPPLSLILC